MKNAMKCLGFIALVAVMGFSMAACGDAGGGPTGGTPQPDVYIGTDSDGSTYELTMDDAAEGGTYTLVITQTDGTVITSTGTIKTINSGSITLQPSAGSSGAFTVAVQGGDTISSITGNITGDNGSTIQAPNIEVPDAMWGTWRIFATPDSKDGGGYHSTVNVTANSSTLSMSGKLNPVFFNDQWGGYYSAWGNVSAQPNAANLNSLRQGSTISFKAKGDGTNTFRLVLVTTDVHDHAYHHYYFTPTAAEQTYEIAINGTNFAQHQTWGNKVSFVQTHITHIDWMITTENNSGSAARDYSLSVRDLVITVPGEGGTGGGEPNPPDPGDPFVADAYSLGDTGPGGGKIFYISEAGFTVYQNSTDTKGIVRHYLEAAPEDMTTKLAWASDSFSSTDISGTGTEIEIGTGKRNTALILAVDADAPAAKSCNEYTNNEKSDWFLPSRDELNQLYVNKSHVGNLKTTLDVTNWTHFYWSSSQSNSNNVGRAQEQNFSDGLQANRGKDRTSSVRAVRAF